MTDEKSTVEGIPKHLLMFNAMNEHDKVLGRLSSLIDKVTGAGTEDSNKDVKEEPSLAQLLAMGEGEMKTMSGILVTQIGRLEEVLF